MPKWNVEDEEALRMMWMEGSHIEDIKEAFHASEDKIRGKIARMCLPSRVPVTERKSKALVRFTRRPEVMPAVETETIHVKRDDIGASQCRWPIGDPRDADFGFCGAEPLTPGKPYCASCCAKAYAGRVRLT